MGYQLPLLSQKQRDNIKNLLQDLTVEGLEDSFWFDANKRIASFLNDKLISCGGSSTPNLNWESAQDTLTDITIELLDIFGPLVHELHNGRNGIYAKEREKIAGFDPGVNLSNYLRHVAYLDLEKCQFGVKQLKLTRLFNYCRQLTILVANPDPVYAENTQEHLWSMGYDVALVNDGKEALDRLDHIIPDVAIISSEFPDISGKGLVYEVKCKTKSNGRQAYIIGVDPFPGVYYFTQKNYFRTRPTDVDRQTVVPVRACLDLHPSVLNKK